MRLASLRLYPLCYHHASEKSAHRTQEHASDIDDDRTHP
jgi:hypothetical protein